MSITWDESAPGDGDLLSQGASVIRALKVAMADGLEPSMYWPGSGDGSYASAGEMKLGSFRMGYGPASGVSQGTAVDTKGLGQLYVLNSWVKRVYAIQTSVETLGILGHAIEHPESCVTTARWVASSGTADLGTTVTFPSAYNGVPRVLVSYVTEVATPEFPVVVKLDSVSVTNFVPSGFTLLESGEWDVILAQQVNWISLGTVGW